MTECMSNVYVTSSRLRRSKGKASPGSQEASPSTVPLSTYPTWSTCSTVKCLSGMTYAPTMQTSCCLTAKLSMPHCALQTPLVSPAASTRRPHLTKLRCTPRLLCTPAHVRQMKTPYGTEDHVGFLAGQSKQTCMAAGCVRGGVRAAADSHDTMGLIAADDPSIHCTSILCQLLGEVLQCGVADQSCRAPPICALGIACIQRNASRSHFNEYVKVCVRPMYVSREPICTAEQGAENQSSLPGIIALCLPCSQALLSIS